MIYWFRFSCFVKHSHRDNFKIKDSGAGIGFRHLRELNLINNLRVYSRNMGNFLVSYASRIVIYNCRGLIRLATGLVTLLKMAGSTHRNHATPASEEKQVYQTYSLFGRAFKNRACRPGCFVLCLFFR